MLGEKADSYLEYLTKNFVVISAVTALGGVTLTYVYLYNYFSAFDSRLIDYVEYQDYVKIDLKFGFLAIPFIATLISNFYSQTKDTVSTKLDLIVMLATSTLIAIPTFLCLRNIYIHRDHLAVIQAYFDASIYTVPLLILSVVHYISRFMTSRKVFWVGMVGMVFISVSLLGVRNGFDTRFDKRFLYQVSMKDGSKQSDDLNNTQLVIALLHHTIIFKDEKAIVLQSPDIKSLTSIARHRE